MTIFSTGARMRSSAWPMRFQASRAIKTAERHGRDAHFVGILSGQEAEAEHLKSVGGGHAIQFFVDGADQHLPPETLDGARGLALFFQPLLHGDAVQIVAVVLTVDGADRARRPPAFPEVRKVRLRNDSAK